MLLYIDVTTYVQVYTIHMCIYKHIYIPVFVLLPPLSRHVFTHPHTKQVGSVRPGEGNIRLATSSKDGAKGPPAVTQVRRDASTCCACHVQREY
jgi:hypothetical protein